MDVLQFSDSPSNVIRPEIHVAELNQVHHFLETLTASTATHKVLTIKSPDGQAKVFLEPSSGVLNIFPVMGAASKENDVIKFFAAKSIVPSVDYEVGQQGMTTRILGFALGSSLAEISAIVVSLFQAVFELEADVEVEFSVFQVADAG